MTDLRSYLDPVDLARRKSRVLQIGGAVPGDLEPFKIDVYLNIL
jgi:hypothetical protein